MSDSHASPAPGSGAALTRREMVALACSVGLLPLNSTMIAVAIPAMALDLGAQVDSLFQWLVTSYLLVGIVAQSPGGKLGDRWGYSRTLTLGQAVFAVGSLAGFLAHALPLPAQPLLVAARVLMALGAAIMMPSAMATVRVRLAEAQRARAFGMFGAVMGLSAAIGPLVGGEVVAHMGWSALFLVNIVPLGVARLMGLRPDPPMAPASASAKPGFDWLGSLLLAGGLALLVAGARLPGLGLPLVGSGLLVLVLFAWWERRVADPVADLRLFRHPAFSAGTLIIGLQNFAMYALLFELPWVFATSFGANPALSGRALLAMTLAMVVGSVIGGRLTGTLGARRTALFGALVSLGGGLVLVLQPLSSVMGTLPALLPLGLGLGLTTPAANAALMATARAGNSGMASGLSSTVRYIGGIAGVAVASAVVSGSDLLMAHAHAAMIYAGALALALALAALIPGTRRS